MNEETFKTGRIVWFDFQTGMVSIHADHDDEIHDMPWHWVDGIHFNPRGCGGLGEIDFSDGDPVRFRICH